MGAPFRPHAVKVSRHSRVPHFKCRPYLRLEQAEGCVMHKVGLEARRVSGRGAGRHRPERGTHLIHLRLGRKLGLNPVQGAGDHLAHVLRRLLGLLRAQAAPLQQLDLPGQQRTRREPRSAAWGASLSCAAVAPAPGCPQAAARHVLPAGRGRPWRRQRLPLASAVPPADATSDAVVSGCSEAWQSSRPARMRLAEGALMAENCTFRHPPRPIRVRRVA